VRGNLEARQRPRSAGHAAERDHRCGAQRVSVGGWLAFTGVEAFAAAAERIRDDGDFSALRGPRRIGEWLDG
jgi:hypothetical protein